MITVRKSSDRGYFDHGWLKTHHTFSFDRYHDPAHMQFRDLRVINEDIIAPGTEFPTHPHRDMEIITYVLDGALTHRDSMGHEATLHRDEVQAMTAGSGITHSESNRADHDPVHLLQIWILPRARGLKPSYRDQRFEPESKQDQWRDLKSPGWFVDDQPGCRAVCRDSPQEQRTETAVRIGSSRMAPGSAGRG